VTNLRVLLVNLESAKDRLDFQRIQAKVLGLDMCRLEAVAAEDVSDSCYQSLAYSWERPLRRPELACFLSHKNAWQNIIERDSPALILEDDAVLSTKLPQLLDELSRQQGIDLVTLENRGRKKHVGRRCLSLDETAHLLRLYQDRTGAAAYVLWPTGAKKLLDRYKRKGAALADAFLFSAYELQAYQLEPAAAIQADHCKVYGVAERLQTSTTTTPAHQPRPEPKNLFWKIRFTLRRIAGQLRLAMHYLAVCHKARRRFISIDKNDFA